MKRLYNFILPSLLFFALFSGSNTIVYTVNAENTLQDCVIPESGPWPPCATGGSNSGQSGGNDSCVIPPSGPWPPCATNGQTNPIPTTQEVGQVTYIVDGDTLTVMLGNVDERIRLIGIDTPERGEPNAREATAALTSLTEGKWVRLEKDVNNRDRYDRLLRYIYVGDLFVNAEMVRLGWAVAYDYPPDTKHSALFHQMEAEARANGRGIHASTPSPAYDPTPTPQPNPTPSSNQNCHPSYPTVCIPPPPPDLNCNDIVHRNFTVVGSDPHNFDRDLDGIGCEG